MTLWRDRLREMLVSARYSTQGAIVSSLAEQGFDVAQPSVSRELRSLGATKVGGRYVLPVQGEHTTDLRVSAALTAAGPLVVLHTEPARASVLAQAIDRASLDGVLGTIAGDDTVFVACAGPEALPGIERFVGRSVS